MKYLKLIFIWLVILVLVNPVGEFPLNDDWAFSGEVASLINHGHLQFTNWGVMTLISQVMLGFGVCKVFGFSFTILRILTSVVALSGILISYKILKHISGNESLALFSSILLAVDPMFISLSNTFMTDIYFISFSMMAIYFFSLSFSSIKNQDLIFASVFLIIATLIRQTGLLLAISFAVVYLMKSTRISWPVILRATIPLILAGVSLMLYENWLNHHPENPSAYYSAGKSLSIVGLKTFSHIFYRMGTIGMTAGLFLLPLLLLSLHDFRNCWKKENRLALAVTLLFTIPLLRAWTSIPLGNIFYDFGLGPKLLKDAYILHRNISPNLGVFMLSILRAICLVGGILFYYLLFSRIFYFKKVFKEHSDTVKTMILFFLVLVVLFVATFAIPDFFFDRYILHILFPLIVVLLPTDLKINFGVSNSFAPYALTFVFFIFGTGLTHDYLSWNRARWQGLDYLVRELHISPHLIDGGFEFNASQQTSAIQNGTSKSWWFVDKDDYILTFGPLEGYGTLKMFPFTQYIPFEKKYIYVLSKN